MNKKKTEIDRSSSTFIKFIKNFFSATKEKSLIIGVHVVFRLMLKESLGEKNE